MRLEMLDMRSFKRAPARGVPKNIPLIDRADRHSDRRLRATPDSTKRFGFR
jgi:hypothetical protein